MSQRALQHAAFLLRVYVLSERESEVLKMLATLARDSDDVAECNIPQLSHRIGRNPSTVRRGLEGLKSRGLLAVQHLYRRQRVSLYTFPQLHAPDAPTPEDYAHVRESAAKPRTNAQVYQLAAQRARLKSATRRCIEALEQEVFVQLEELLTLRPESDTAPVA